MLANGKIKEKLFSRVPLNPSCHCLDIILIICIVHKYNTIKCFYLKNIEFVAAW